jgi:hypothetical protein
MIVHNIAKQGSSLDEILSENMPTTSRFAKHLQKLDVVLCRGSILMVHLQS